MLTYYRYKLEKGMMTLADVPEPYRTQLQGPLNTDQGDGEE
ncbi:hypothetical protein SAMN05518847_101889 [Paenibacillus sp. OV219]|nr:hypothetical protein SAMN05518847_101889 [Paenibacillus sp. OV219]